MIGIKVDPMIARLYKKKNCKTCYGRGLLQVEVPNTRLNFFVRGVQNTLQTHYCPCVERAIKEQRQNVNSTKS